MSDTQTTAQNALFTSATSNLRYASREIDPVTGQPIAQPAYLVDASGNPITTLNPLGVNATFSASSIAINDPNTTTQKMAVDASGNASVKLGAALPSGTNLIGNVELVDSGGTNKASISAGGAVKVDNSAVTQPVSGTVTANAGTNLNTSLLALESGGNLASIKSDADSIVTNTANIPAKGQATMANSLPVTMASNQSTVNVAQQASGSTSATLQNAQNGTANGSTLNVLGMSACSFVVNMSGFTGTVNFEASSDGTNFNAITVVQLGTSTLTTTATGSTTTSITTYEGSVGSLQLIRARTSSVSAGTVTVTAEATPVPFSPRTINANLFAAGTALVADQSNTELRVSNYGKSTAAGDTPILLDSTGRTLIGRSTAALYTLASTATSGSTQNSGDLPVSSYTELGIDITTTAQSGTNPTIQYFYERKGADGVYYPLWQSAVLTAASNTLSTSIGTGMAYNQHLGITGRLRWVIGGSATPTYTHQINMYAK